MIARDGVLVRVLATTGLRVSEALALTWANLDLDAGVLRVVAHRAYDAEGAWGVAAGSKTAAGTRAVLLLPSTVAALVAWRRRRLALRLAAGPAWAVEEVVPGKDRTVPPEHDLVFGDDLGCPRPATALRHSLPRLCAAAGVRAVVAHELRHTHSTHCRLVGMDYDTLQRRLGHQGGGATRTYLHLGAADQREAVMRLEAALSQMAAAGHPAAAPIG